MKTIQFYKYQGTGNDFVMIDNRDFSFPTTKENIHHLCNRHFGIGADGLILVENDETSDFKMVYFNSDGNESSMCGNGGRCIVAFAKYLKIIDKKTYFTAIDGLHYAEIEDDIVKLQMIDVSEIEKINNDYILNTGSPHYIVFTSDIKNIDLIHDAKKIRYNEHFFQEGINVNFVEQIADHHIFVRTYERGVEDETLACGTGVTASTLAFAEQENLKINKLEVTVLGGNLEVYWEKSEKGYKNIFLEGPAKQVFEGRIKL